MYGRKATTRFRAQPRIEGPNRLELAYETDVLKTLAAPPPWDQDPLDWKFEGMKFRLGPKLFYTPDYNVLLADGTMEQVEVKPYNKKRGSPYWTEDSRVKFKAAAQTFPMFRWVAVWKTDEGWQREVMRPTS